MHGLTFEPHEAPAFYQQLAARAAARAAPAFLPAAAAPAFLPAAAAPPLLAKILTLLSHTRSLLNCVVWR